MDGLIVMTVITFLLIDLCAMAYLSRLFLKIVFKFIDYEEVFHEK